MAAHLQAYQEGLADEGFSGELWWAMAKVFVLCATATLLPLRQSLKRLEALEV